MKRYALIFLAFILVAASFCGCSGDEKASDPTTSLNYTIMINSTTENLDNGVKSVKYPSLDGSASGVDYSAVNALIKDKVTAQYDLQGVNWSDEEEFSYDVDSVEVMLATNDVFSAVISGSYYISGAAHDTVFAFSVNADLAAVKLLGFDDIAADFGALKAAFESGAFVQNLGVKSLTESTGYADIFVEYREDYNLMPDVYLTPTSFGVVVELVYALGGMATFELPYADAAAFLNQNCAVLTPFVNFDAAAETTAE